MTTDPQRGALSSQTSVEAIRRLHLLGQKSIRTSSLEELLGSAADSVAELLSADRVSIFGVDREAGKVTAFAKGGPGQDGVVEVGFDELWSGLTGWVLREKSSALSAKGTPDPRENPDVARRRIETDCGSILVVPLQVDGEVMGTMTAINRRAQRDFDRRDLELMELFADYCAVVLESTRQNLELAGARARLDKLNEDLMLENDRKDRLFLILSHDLRGPVGNTSVMLNMLTSSDLGQDDRQALFEGAREAAAQSFALTDNVLGWIRGQFSAKSGYADRHDVDAMLDRVCLWLKPQADQKRIAVKRQVAPLLSAFCVEGVVTTIIRNLISNALKYSSEESEVALRAFSQDNWISIEVEDRGVGMSADTLGQIFGKIKLDSAPGTRGEAGNGLGLMFCADLAKSIGAQLEAHSSLGQGSTFTLRLPEVLDAELGAPGLSDVTEE